MSVTPTRMAVIGAGTMGCDIAATFSHAGWHAHLVEPHEVARDALPARIGRTFDQLGSAAGARARWSAHAALAELPWSALDLVIEAIPERLEPKQALFAELERLARRDTPLCSNSSAIGIGKIGAGLATRERMLNTHYFMPAHLVPAVEVVSSEATDPAAAMTFGAGGGTQAAEQATKTESTLGDGDATGAAAQAPSADAAPQAPAPDVVKPPAPMVGRVLRVVGPAKGRWRAGRKFGPEPVEIPVAELSLEDMAKLATDPELVVGLVEED